MSRRLGLTACVLTGAAGLLASIAPVTAQPASTGQASAVPLLIQRQGQEKQRVIEGQAATQQSRRQAQAVGQAPRPSLAPSAGSASSPQPVTQADVLLQREQRIRRLNAAKLGRTAKP